MIGSCEVAAAAIEGINSFTAIESDSTKATSVRTETERLVEAKAGTQTVATKLSANKHSEMNAPHLIVGADWLGAG